jgi:UDP-N-acetylmuramate--alanine ligase
MIAWVLTDLGQDPTYIIGSVSTNLQRNAHAGEGPDFVIEADEYDYMFLGLSPTIAVITNIEHDHPDIFPTPESFYAAFHSFTKMILPGGWLLACEDDPGARRLLQAENPFARLGYAIEKPDASLRAVNLRRNRRGGFTFDVKASTRKETGEPKSMAHIDLGVPGRHNVMNALAAFGVVHSLGLPGKAIAASLGKFSGTARRFEVVADTQGIVVVSDYAHHPTEIRATIAAARQRFPEYRLWAIWQPHTYSRVQALFDEFSTSFDQADQVIVTEIFPAREAEPAGGFSAKQIVLAMAHSQAAYAATLDAARDMLLEELQSGDAVLILSAGDADLLARQLEVALSARDPEQQKEAGG